MQLSGLEKSHRRPYKIFHLRFRLQIFITTFSSTLDVSEFKWDQLLVIYMENVSVSPQMVVPPSFYSSLWSSV